MNWRFIVDKKVDWNRIDATIRSFLGTKQYLVGVKILNEIMPGNKVRRLDRPTAFCKVIKEASQGEAYIYSRPDEGCPTGEIVLGFREPKYSELETRIKPAKTKYVYVASLNVFQGDPDVIISIINPKQMMNLTQVLQSVTNESIEANFKGESACSDFFVKPYLEGKPNISFLCNGARLTADFKDNELIFGAPPEIYAKLSKVMENLCKTGGALCGCKTSDIPADMIYSFGKLGLSKSTDYFFGRIRKRSVRVYINRDDQGKLRLITVHVPLKMDSKREASDLATRLEQAVTPPYRVNQREDWIDISMISSADELNIDLHTGDNLENVLNQVLDKVDKDLKRVGYEASLQ
jgi:uncharacterized protein (DUF169 family)